MSTNDRLAAEVAASAWPDDAPTLRPLVALDRRSRANMVRAISHIWPRIEAMQPAAPPPDPDAPARNAGKSAWLAHAEQLGITVPKNATRADAQRLVDEHRAAAAPPLTRQQESALTAEMIDLAADVADMVVAVAEDPDEARAWADRVGDVELITAFFGYYQESQPGEARRSSS